nr:hypothetical protein [Candidatus Bathyarchaeota archaeon]
LLLEHGFTNVFPVNPKESEVLGMKCYPSVKDVPSDVDLACILTPASTVPGIIRDCAEKGVKAAIIFSSGFAEAGNVDLQEQVVELARSAGIRILGPNSQGVVSTPANLCATFSPSIMIPDAPLRGNVSVISQSGAIGGSALTHMWSLKLGVSRFVSTGNEADLETPDFLDFLAGDEHTSVITVFLESIKDVEGFSRAVSRAISSGKPVVVFWSARSRRARKLVKQHTGLKPPEDYTPLFKKLGVLGVDDFEDFFDFPMALAWQPAPSGNGVAIISTSGAMCSVMVDLCEEYGLEVPELDGDAENKLRGILPSFASAKNPLDVTGQIILNISLFKKCLRVLCGETRINALLLTVTTAVDEPAITLARDIVEAAETVRSYGKPMIVCWLASRAFSQKSHEILLEAKIPVYPTPRRAVKALKALVEWGKIKGKREKLQHS